MCLPKTKKMDNKINKSNRPLNNNQSKQLRKTNKQNRAQSNINSNRSNRNKQILKHYDVYINLINLNYATIA